MTQIQVYGSKVDSCDVARTRAAGVPIPPLSLRGQGNTGNTIATQGTLWLPLWVGANALANDIDDPQASADEQGICWQIPKEFNGFLELCFLRDTLEAADTYDPPGTFPEGRLFGLSDGYWTDDETDLLKVWTPLPDVDGTVLATFAVDGTNHFDATNFIVASETKVFDLRGSELIRFLPSQAHVEDGGDTINRSLILGRFFTTL